MKPRACAFLVLAPLLALSGCDAHRHFLDFISDPVLPPVANPASGTYDHTMKAYLDRGDGNDSILYFTFNPDAPYTDLSQWRDYYASVGDGFDISGSTQLRVFSYVSPARFSEVRTITWELKCPQATFFVDSGSIVYITPPNDTAFTVFYDYTTDGSEPSTSSLPHPAPGGSTSFNIGYVSPAQPRMRIYAVTQRPGWSDSAPVIKDIVYGAPIASSIQGIPAARVAEGAR